MKLDINSDLNLWFERAILLLGHERVPYTIHSIHNLTAKAKEKESMKYWLENAEQFNGFGAIVAKVSSLGNIKAAEYIVLSTRRIFLPEKRFGYLQVYDSIGADIFTTCHHVKQYRRVFRISDIKPHLTSTCPVYTSMIYHFRPRIDLLGHLFDEYPDYSRALSDVKNDAAYVRAFSPSFAVGLHKGSKNPVVYYKNQIVGTALENEVSLANGAEPLREALLETVPHHVNVVVGGTP